MKTNTRSNPKDFLIGQDVELYLLHRGKVTCRFEERILNQNLDWTGLLVQVILVKLGLLEVKYQNWKLLIQFHKVFKRKIKNTLKKF